MAVYPILFPSTVPDAAEIQVPAKTFPWAQRPEAFLPANWLKVGEVRHQDEIAELHQQMDFVMFVFQTLFLP
jgi:hypothetical protein